MRIAIIVAAALAVAAATALVACSPAARTCAGNERTAVLAVLANPTLTEQQKLEQLAVLGVDFLACAYEQHKAGSSSGSGSGSGK